MVICEVALELTRALAPKVDLSRAWSEVGLRATQLRGERESAVRVIMADELAPAARVLGLFSARACTHSGVG